ncbi:U-box domain-containing protein 17-like [Cornus florida]|uniref:U-box domain-containing protein 17-like n=1 Tax=Cornus florida TaxID=4283 RepID=UPI00289FE2EF|nr:U-box domain-containing protein 17-like [Cornus florida]
MASASIFSSLRMRRSPCLVSVKPPEDITGIELVDTLVLLSSELTKTCSGKTLPFQKKNSRSLTRKFEVFVVLLEYIRDSGTSLPSTAILCLKELYLILHRSKILLEYCSHSSKLWLLLQNHSISGHFHDLNQEISTLLDVFPTKELNLSDDIREQVELLQKQLIRAKLVIDKHDETLRLELFSILNEFENGEIPDSVKLCLFFEQRLGIQDAKSCRGEIEFLEEQIVNHEGDIELTISVLNGFMALTRYCRFLLFGFEEDEDDKKLKKGLITQQIVDIDVDASLMIPKDFCCPISLELMQDPVIVSTGHTYDRASISRWMEEGNCTCPKTGQMLVHSRLVSNQALTNLIMQWCTAHGIPFDPPDSDDLCAESFAADSASKATIEANKATVVLLIQQLANGSQGAKTIAAREIRLLAKTGKENRAYIAEAGAIPHLKRLLSSPNAVAQENSVTAMLNLSIYGSNKRLIVDEEGCLGSIVEVMRTGHTIEAMENAGATLFSLSAVHEYKKRIANEDGAVEALARMLREGTPRGKTDAVTALFNLSTHTDTCARIIESGAVTALVGVLEDEGVAEDAASALALIVRQPLGAEAVANEDTAVAGLIGMLRYGTARGKENAVAALLELCQSGGAAATERVVKAPALASLLQTLLFTGTKRARRKAASLAKVFQRSENAYLHFGGLGVGYAFAGNSAANRELSFAHDVSVPISISVPVL